MAVIAGRDNDDNSVITSPFLISFDYDLQDVTQMLHSSVIPLLDPTE